MVEEVRGRGRLRAIVLLMRRSLDNRHYRHIGFGFPFTLMYQVQRGLRPLAFKPLPARAILG